MRLGTAVAVACLSMLGVSNADEAGAAVKKYTSIPAQELSAALRQLAKERDVQLVYRSEVVGDRGTGGASGELTLDEALTQLLHGTGLTYQYLADRALTIVPTAAPIPQDGEGSGVRPSREDTQTFGTGDPGKQRSGDRDDGKGIWDRFRLAQVDPESRADSSAADRRSSVSRSERALVEEVIVTAQRREERLTDVPISISVLSADEVERRGLISREDYLRTIPAVSIRDDGVGLAEIVIRGAYGDSFRTGPTVGLYFGDVPLTGYAIGGSADIKLIDLQRVEILRGPQGTLYGSNSLSGAIRYIPTQPDLQEVSGSLRAAYSSTSGNGGANNSVDGVLNLPVVSNKLAVRAVAFRHFYEGYVRNVAGDDAALGAAAAASGASQLAINEDHVGDTEYIGGRVSALWQPTDALAINLIYLKQRDAQDDRLFELRQAGAYQRSDYQLSEVIGGSEDAQRIDLDILNLTAHYDLGWGTLYSSTAWTEQNFIRKWDIGSFTSLFGTPIRPIGQISTTDADIFTQEARLTSTFAGPLQLVAGLYYEDSEQPTTQPTYFGGNPALNPWAAVKLWQIDLERDVEQRAAYGEVSYNFTDKLRLKVGGRYFKYDSLFSTRTFDTVILAPAFSETATGESGETFKAGVEFKPTDEALVYANWSQGFRLGRPLATEFIRSVCDRDRDGLLDGTTISSNLNRIDSDRLDSYELGTKVRFMGGGALLSAAVYQNDWSDIPITFTPPGCAVSLSINGGSARARGLEAEASVRFLDFVRLSLAVGYVESELTSTTSLGRDGDELNFTPEINGNLGLEFTFSVAQRNAFVRSDYSYFGSYYTQTGHRGIRADAYDLLNISAGIAMTRSSELQIHVDNALDADDFTTVVGPGGFPPGYSVRLRPRTIGVGLAYRF